MSAPNAAPGEAFVARFRRELGRRIGGRVRDLEVRCEERQVVVCCTVPSYHAKQLVILAALTALSPDEGHDVILNVRVGPPPLAEGSGGDGAATAVGPLSLARGRGR